MAPVNPYLCKSSKKAAAASSSQPRPPSNNAANTNKSGNTKATASVASSQPKPKPKPPVTVAAPKRQLPVPAVAPKPRPVAPANTSVPRPVSAVSVAPIKRPPPATAFSSSSLKQQQPKSFKSKLKHQIESLKRAKQLEKQRKRMEQQHKKEQEQVKKQQQPSSQQQRDRSDSMQQSSKQQAMPPHRPQAMQTTVSHQAAAAGRMPPTNYVTPAKTSIGTAQQVNQGFVVSKNNTMLASVASVQQVTPAAGGVASKQTPSPAAAVDSSKSRSTAVPARLNGQSKQVPVKSNKGEASTMGEVAVAANSVPVNAKSKVDSRSSEMTTAQVPNQMPYPHESQPYNAPLPPQNLADPAAAFAASMQYNNIPPYGAPQAFGPANYPPMMMMPPPSPTAGGYAPPFGWHPYQQQAMMMNMAMGHPAAWSQQSAPFIPAPTRAPAPRAPPVQAPPKTPTAATAVLHQQPLHPVSPYADTHQLLGEEICIFKSLGGSFGVSFKYETRSALLDPHVADSLTTGGEKLTANKTKQESATPEKKEESVSTNLASHATLPVANAASKASDETAKQRRPRRRRVFFGVLTVTTAEKQNAQFKSKNQLQPGDVVLKINGHALGGLTFQQAIALFASCGSKADGTPAAASEGDSPALIRCPLVVARMKSRPVVPLYSGVPGAPHFGVSGPQHQQPSLKVPFVVNSITDQIVSGDFTSAELLALAQGALRCLSTESRALGHVTPAQVELACLQNLGLMQRDLTSIKSKQQHFISSAEQAMKNASSDHWASQWKLEQERSKGSDAALANLSDAERSTLRQRPRPLKGCRCGSMDHEFVDDSKCVLYNNLRQLSGKQAEAGEKPKAPKKAKASQLNAVATANKERMLKLKEVTEREEQEAQFVEDMEVLQVKKLKVAVFVPSLTSMVLSAVAEVAKELSSDDLILDPVTASNKNGEGAATASSPAEPENTSMDNAKVIDSAPDDDDDDDEDDDVPLMELSKRSASSSQEPDAKRLKTQDTNESTGGKDGDNKERPSVNMSFMAKVLRHISHTWGHLFTEPSDSEHSWRWEVYHGQTASSGDAYQETKSANPRPMDSRSFENIQFALTDEVLSRLATSPAKQSDAMQASASDVPLVNSSDLLLVSHLLSPKRTGVYDEIMALVKMGVLRKTRSGCVILAKGWQGHVDPLILDDMEQHWSKRQDPMNKHCICKSVRSKLARSWMRVDGGWAMSADPDDVIYRDDEYDEWREHFLARFESQINETEGIEKFGI